MNNIIKVNFQKPSNKLTQVLERAKRTSIMKNALNNFKKKI